MNAERNESVWRRLARTAWWGLGLPLVLAFVLLAIWPPLGVVETGQTPEYPDLQPVAYMLGQERVFAAVNEVVSAWPNARIELSDAATGRVEFVAASRWSRLTTRMQVRVESNGDGGSIVFVRSESTGRGDLGQNARNVRRTLRVLDEQLSLRRPGVE